MCTAFPRKPGLTLLPTPNALCTCTQASWLLAHTPNLSSPHANSPHVSHFMFCAPGTTYPFAYQQVSWLLALLRVGTGPSSSCTPIACLPCKPGLKLFLTPQAEPMLHVPCTRQQVSWLLALLRVGTGPSSPHLAALSALLTAYEGQRAHAAALEAAGERLALAVEDAMDRWGGTAASSVGICAFMEAAQHTLYKSGTVVRY